MADLTPPLTITSRSPASIQVDIDRTVARLRALRTRQADAHFVDRPGLAAEIQVLQDKLDRLYEEKRAAQAITGRAGRQHTSDHSPRSVEATPAHKRTTEARLLVGLFSDSIGQP